MATSTKQLQLPVPTTLHSAHHICFMTQDIQLDRGFKTSYF